MTKQQSQVSVVIPCYNGARYVGQALDSVLDQTRSPLEVIVVDDGSTDDSAAVVGRFGDPVRLIRQHNQGRAAAVQTALNAARGELVAFLDADDWWAPHKIEHQTDTLLAERAGLVHSRAVRCNQDGSPVSDRAGAPTGRWALPQLLGGNLLCVNSVMVRRSLLERVGGFVARYWPCDDYHLWLRLAAAAPFAFVDRQLAYYRTHDEQVSADRAYMLRQEMAVVHDFLADHPGVRRAMAPELLRQVSVNRFIERGVHYYDIGRQRDARAIFRECLRRWPIKQRVWHYAALAHLPWSWYARRASVSGAH